MTHLRTSPRAAIRVAALRAVLEVAGPRRGAGRVLSRGASDADIGREVRRALAACGRIAVPTSRSHDLIHPRPAFCDGAWTKARRPVRLARVTGRGPLPDRVRAAGVRWIGDALLLTPRARHGVPLPLARLALRATAPDEDLGAALRQALALGR